MYARTLRPPAQSFFLFGPRGTGKSSWLRQELPGAFTFDLLDQRTWLTLHAEPWRLERLVPPDHADWVVIDEVQRAPALLDEVHRLIEGRGWRFALTGSSARTLRRRGTNLLAGRALTLAMHPLTRAELGPDFDLAHTLRYGSLPATQVARATAGEFLHSYVATYLREEVLQEGLTRNLAGFHRFLEAASFSQGAPLNVAAVARDCAVPRKTVDDYFAILDDLMLAIRVPPFTRRARRDVQQHPKFYFFDAGVYRAIRPRGPLDSDEEIDGAALETLVLHEIRATNDAWHLGYQLHYWRTRDGKEVDFVLYGERGLHAIEVKRGDRLRDGDLDALRLFMADYPEATATVIYGGDRSFHDGPIRVEGVETALSVLPGRLGAAA